MKPYHQLARKGEELRRFIRSVGEELVDSILDLARADELGSIPNKKQIPDLIEKINKVKSEPLPSTH